MPSQNIFDLTGKVAAVVGAGSGIGRALALELAARGAVLALSDVDAAAAERTAEQCRATGTTARAWRVDVAAVFSCGSVGPPASAHLVIDQSTLKMQPRAPDPAPGAGAADGAALPEPAGPAPGRVAAGVGRRGRAVGGGAAGLSGLRAAGAPGRRPGLRLDGGRA